MNTLYVWRSWHVVQTRILFSTLVPLNSADFFVGLPFDKSFFWLTFSGFFTLTMRKLSEIRIRIIVHEDAGPSIMWEVKTSRSPVDDYTLRTLFLMAMQIWENAVDDLICIGIRVFSARPFSRYIYYYKWHVIYLTTKSKQNECSALSLMMLSPEERLDEHRPKHYGRQLLLDKNEFLIVDDLLCIIDISSNEGA